ncbi:MAG TPA: response regulator [Symbiobacteriaceae bacterium]|nr:response regulator [Symbiobacteriaceae bacterium]
MPRILVVDDEPQIRRFLRAALAAESYDVVEADTVRQALALASAERPDLVILDLGLPDGDGLTVVTSLRTWSDLPVIILSVRGQESDKIAALDAGADDYLTKPFGAGELMARTRAALRRAMREQPEAVLSFGDLTVDTVKRLVTVQGREVHLTATEYGLLQALASHAGRVLTHRQLLSMVWGPGYESESHILRVNVSNLRHKLEPNPLQPRYIITEPGVGYRFKTEFA